MKPKKKSVIKTLIKDVNKLQKENPPNFRFNSSQGQTLTTSLINSAPAQVLLNGFAPGTDELSRVGDVGHHISTIVNVKIIATSSLLTPTNVRIVIVREKTALGSLPTYNGMFNSTQPTVDYTYNEVTRESSRYVYHYDKIHAIAPPSTTNATASVSGNQSVMSEKVIRIRINKTFKSDYSRGTAGTVADIDDNSLTLCVFTDCSTSNAVGIYYSSLCKYSF